MDKTLPYPLFYMLKLLDPTIWNKPHRPVQTWYDSLGVHCVCAGRLVVFCAKTELAALYQTEYVICDGTFEMAPNTAYQLYTMHGFVNGEALALVMAARQLAGRRPLYFTADVSILLLFFAG